jgi:cupin domain
MNVRRVVTGHDEAGRAVVASDGIAPRHRDFVHTPQMSQTLVWATQPGDRLPPDANDRTLDLESIVPPPGGSRFIFVRFPPDAVFGSADFDPAASAGEHAQASPGLAHLFEPDAPGMHTTPTVDYVIVIEGELWLKLDDEETLLRTGDTVIQNATRHGWSVRTEGPAAIAVVMVGLAGPD